MGLDIGAYKGITKSNLVAEEGVDLEEQAYSLGLRVPYINPSFPKQAEGLEEVAYQYESSLHFRAGSYSGYNLWRAELARLAGVDLEALWGNGSEEELPFAELLNFSDCEGSIGPQVCQKLARDFAAYDAQAKTHALDHPQQGWGGDSWFYDRYRKWHQAFEYGSTGFVDFH